MSAVGTKNRPRTAYLGPEGTFTHQAALDLLGDEIELVAVSKAPDVVQAVERGDVVAGVVAFENSLEGPIPASAHTAHGIMLGS